MGNPETQSPDESVPPSTVFDVLRHSRRRDILRYLLGRNQVAAVADIAKHVAAIEHDTTINTTPGDATDRVHISLYHLHLPKLEDGGLIDYDRDRNVVTLTEQGRHVTPWIVTDAVESEAAASDTRTTHRTPSE